MILVDTSVWIDHFNKNDTHLVRLLEEDSVCVHPFIIGELATKTQLDILIKQY